MLHPRSLLRVVGASVVLAAACRESPAPTGPDTGLLSTSLQGPELPTADQLDRAVPGFGGYSLAPDGTPTVFLIAGSNRGVVERAFAGHMRTLGRTPEEVKIVEGKFAWRQLEGWKDAATPDALDVPGAVYLDNDETTNRVRIGVQDLTAMALVRQATQRLGIPDEAVMIVRAEPIFLKANLQTVVDRPVRAGVQINFPGFLCSVGFNATSGSEKSFVTASHCTNTQGGVESTPYWQPLESVDPTQIATEVADPVYTKGLAGCPKAKHCRYSDASRAAYINGANQALGQIAHTTATQPNTYSLNVDATNFSITTVDEGTLGGTVVAGQVVDKVGRTTGWTEGTVTGTCVNVGVQGTRIVQLCQTLVQSGVQIVGAGDSGSGMFMITGGSNVQLVGILWGGNGSGTTLVYSPFANIEQELGQLTVH